MPLASVMEAVMRGNAEMQGQAQVKKIAGDQADANKMVKLSFTGKHSEGGVPVIKFEGPADLLNGSQQDDLTKAYETPKQNVEMALNGAQRREALTKDFGYDLPTADVQPTDVDSFGERYRARRELGGSVIKSAIMSGITGSRRDEKLVTNLKNRRSSLQSAVVQKEIAPLLDQDMQGIGQQLEAGRLANSMTSESRQAVQQRLNLRNQLLDQKNIMQFATPEEYVQNSADAMGEVGGFVAGDAEKFATAWKTNRVSFLNERRRALSGEEGRLAIQSYGDTPEEIERFVDEQVGAANLSPFERQQMVRTAKGLSAWKQDQERKQANEQANQRRADERIALAIAAAGRSSEEKPRKLTAFDTMHASVDALLSAKGDPSFEQTSVEQAIRNRAGSLDKRIAEISEQLSANDLAFADINKQRAKEGYGDDESLIKQLNAKKERGRQLVLESRRLQAERAKLNDVPQIEYITQAEYDALIAAGETAESIAADGIRVKGRK